MDDSIASGLLTETLTEGRSGNITVSGKRLAIANGATIASSTYSSGKTGDFKIDFSESVELFGLSPIRNRSGAINPTTYAAGNSGDVYLSTKDLTILDGAVIGSFTLGSGNAADVTVNITDTIKGRC